MICSTSSWSQDGVQTAQRTFSMSSTSGACQPEVPLYRGSQLTLHFPRDVRVAIPSTEEGTQIFVNGRLVVVKAFPLESQQRPQHSPKQMSVTVELQSGESFYCPIALLSPSPDHPQSVELIRVIDQSEQERQLQEFNALLLKLIQKTSPIPSQLHQQIQRYEKELMQRGIDQFLSASHLSISDSIPLRAQDELIYVTIVRAFKLEDKLYLRVQLRNHSQDPFTLDQVDYLFTEDAPRKRVWPRQTSTTHLSSSPMIIIPSGQPYFLAIQLPSSAIQTGSLIFRGKNGRTISISLSFDELKEK